VAKQAGLKYVYVGNVHDPEHHATYCHSCGKSVIARDWYELGAYHLEGNRCGHCGTEIPGRFDQQPGDWGRKRLPVRISQFHAATPAEDHLVQISSFAHNSRLSSTATKEAPAMSSPTETSTPAASTNVPQLDKRQQRLIHDTACELVAAEVLRRRPHLEEYELGELAQFPLLGAFVTLRRQGKLRACCGTIGRIAPLAEVLDQAARRTATEDVRLPTISPTELEHLDLDVWLLYNQQEVTATGRDRIGAVSVGQHGLQIARGNQRGLLLPGVATDLGLDSEHFLQQVCLKAGLPPTAYLEADTKLGTFEGKEIAGPFHVRKSDADLGATPPMFSDLELAALANFCRENIKRLLEGSTPNYYLFGVADGEVHGIAISIMRPGNPEPLHIVKLSLRPGLPLQTTLFSLTETAARALAAEGIYANQVDSLAVDVSIYYDPAMHGTATAADLRGFEPAERALLVAERGRSAWMINQEHSGQELLAEAVGQLNLMNPATAAVYSLEAQTTRRPLSIIIGPQGQPGAAVRPPAVAGTFYPAEAAALESMVSDLLPAEPLARKAYAAVMVPHAGLVYSGRLAAEVLAQTEPADTVIVIGPKHTPHGVDWAVAPHAEWSLPTGNLPADPELAKQLAEAIPNLLLDAAAHAREHAIEVELPFLQRLAPAAKVVGIVIGSGGLEQCQQFGKQLAGVISRRSERVLLVISSDMNHFASEQETRRLDEMALSALESLDSEHLFNTCREHNISMCGMLPAVIVMEALKELGQLNHCQRTSYATSAQVNNDPSRVVGYAGMLFD
jgi:AmmeMemoRadiSam system protein B/AmmeMemoRadiSam system protein A